MKVKVEIREYLQRTVEVEALDMDDAYSIVRELYRKEKIVLDSSDYICTEFEVLE